MGRGTTYARVRLAGSLAVSVAMALSTVGVCAVVVDTAYWAPDRGTPYKWFESAKEIQSFFEKDYRAAGTLYLYIRNSSTRPASVTDFRLDRRALEELRKEHTVVWWRLLPDPVGPGGIGEVMIRLRSALDRPAEIGLTLDDGSTVTATVKPEPAPLRIETVGFNATMDRVFIVAERLRAGPLHLSRVIVDGRDVTAQCRLLDPAFATGVSPVMIRLPRPLSHGSYHVYKVMTTEGAAAACCVRTYDGWVPLGTYGYGEYEEFARNGCNGHNCFGRYAKGDLDSQATLGMRGVTIVGDSPPSDYMVGHPGLFAYCLTDEPDCGDYGFNEIPAHLRIGALAMEMDRRCRFCRKADPAKLTFLTLDLTYKPANYYIYGPIADVVNCDCYPVSLGADASMVREVVETARYGAGPRPLTFTFQGCYEEPTEAEARDAKRFPRPPFAEEERLMMYYAIGAGARGLFNYIHCSEMWAGGKVMSHGSKEYLDVWREIGRVYGEIQHVAPYLALAHPTKLASASTEKMRVSTLLCGDSAMLLVCVNEDYSQQRKAFRYRPAEQFTLTVPAVPWLKPVVAWRVGEAGLIPMKASAHDGRFEVTADRVDVAELILVSSDPKAGEVANRACEDRQRTVGASLLAEWRRRQQAEADHLHTVRRLTGEFADFIVMGKSVGAYGIKEARFWNPANEDYWAFEFGQNDARPAPDQGAEWTVHVPAERAGKGHVIYAVCGTWGQPAVLSVSLPEGQVIANREVSGGFAGQLVAVRVEFLKAGDYGVRFIQSGPGPRGGRIAHALFIIPEESNPPRLQ